MSRLLIVALVLALSLRSTRAAEATETATLAKLALKWMLFDDSGVAQIPEETTPPRPVDHSTARFREYLRQQQHLRVIYDVHGSVGRAYFTVPYDVRAGAFETDPRPLSPDEVEHLQTGALNLYIRNWGEGRWRVTFSMSTPLNGGPKAEIIEHANGYSVGYAGYRIVCP
jgi:hypothetical protein